MNDLIFAILFYVIPLVSVILAFIHDTIMEVRNNVKVDERNSYRDMLFSIIFAIVPLVNIVVAFLYWGEFLINPLLEKVKDFLDNPVIK